MSQTNTEEGILSKLWEENYFCWRQCNNPSTASRKDFLKLEDTINRPCRLCTDTQVDSEENNHRYLYNIQSKKQLSQTSSTIYGFIPAQGYQSYIETEVSGCYEKLLEVFRLSV